MLQNYFGGQSVASRNSSILLVSVLTSPSKVRKGGCVPGARLCRSVGFLQSRGPKGQRQKVIFHTRQPLEKCPPFEVDGGDVEDDAFEPKDHEETLREGAVPNAFSVTAGLQTNARRIYDILHHNHETFVPEIKGSLNFFHI